MTSFSGVEADLEQAASYELDALEFVRATLFSQTEVPANGPHATSSAIGTGSTVLRSRADYELWASATSPLPRARLAEWVCGEVDWHDPTGMS